MTGGHRVPPWLRRLLGLHQAVYELSHGWVGHRLLGDPTLLLHTTGARSGRRRTAALIYWRDGESYLLAASNGGADNHPAWYHNLRKHPDVEVMVKRSTFAATARILLPGDADYARLWALIVADHQNYIGYQQATNRLIPLVLLDVRTS
ncbi:nitroreductase family deazaflavin-dependent oxidoreductase [Mycobacterium sp. NPDC003323]